MPAPYTLTNRGIVTVGGVLDISGTYSGEKVQVNPNGTITPSSIPHRKRGVLAAEITIAGEDTVSANGSASYTAEILPNNAWEEQAEWSIVFGEGLAKIDANGLLTAGNTPGTVTIRAAAIDGTKVYGEKTVTIQAASGDMNGDGKVNGKDVTALSRHLAGWDVEINELAADVNGDGVVNGKDVTLLSRYLAGWDVKLK